MICMSIVKYCESNHIQIYTNIVRVYGYFTRLSHYTFDKPVSAYRLWFSMALPVIKNETSIKNKIIINILCRYI